MWQVRLDEKGLPELWSRGGYPEQWQGREVGIGLPEATAHSTWQNGWRRGLSAVRSEATVFSSLRIGTGMARDICSAARTFLAASEH
jgi:hypothetical protein